MIEAHVVNALNKNLYEKDFDEFSCEHRDFLVHQKRWRPASPDGRELGQFDTDAATCLLGIEEELAITSARLIPTREPHMVSEIFPPMCEKSGVPRRPDWAEWTRTFVIPTNAQLGAEARSQRCAARSWTNVLDEGPRCRGRCPGNVLHDPGPKVIWKLVSGGFMRGHSHLCTCRDSRLACNALKRRELRKFAAIASLAFFQVLCPGMASLSQADHGKVRAPPPEPHLSFALYVLSRGGGVPATSLKVLDDFRAMLKAYKEKGVAVELTETRIGLEGERRLCAEFKDQQTAHEAWLQATNIVAGVDLANLKAEPCQR
ncbi:acyl-homoserine-lactone synthase [Mesorhizobium sp. f-mel]